MMKRKLAASLLAGVLVAGLTVTSASAAGATGTTVTGGGSGQVYSPEDIIDVVVPTDFKIAFNPLKVNIPADSDVGLHSSFPHHRFYKIRTTPRGADGKGPRSHCRSGRCHQKNRFS